MIFEVVVEYVNREKVKKKVRCFVEDEDLSAAAKESEAAVHDRTKQSASAVSGKEVGSSLVLIKDGQKPYWLSFEESKDLNGQGEMHV